ncbi:unnamed protein product [Meloidogyne enterolobii]|uniref:Uncharacterized protein n=1 Tax=Meloidogyne enterolobii TaxID=390850 RepID=A0ACB0YKR4_MELEN
MPKQVLSLYKIVFCFTRCTGCCGCPSPAGQVSSPLPPSFFLPFFPLLIKASI